MLKALLIFSLAPWVVSTAISMEVFSPPLLNSEENIQQTPACIIENHSIRVSVNHQLENLEKFPGEINIIDTLTNTLIGQVDKKSPKSQRINVNPNYVLSQIHSNGIKLELCYNEGGGPGQVMPIHFYKSFESQAEEICPILGYFKKESDLGGEASKNNGNGAKKDEFVLAPLLAIRLNIMENRVIGGTCPLRASGYYRYGFDSGPINQFFGLSLATPNSFCNDEEIFNYVVASAPLSMPLQPATLSIYIDSGSNNDSHKGQLYVMNEYIKLALLKYKTQITQDLPCYFDSLLNFFVTKGMVQSNEKAKYFTELKEFFERIS